MKIQIRDLGLPLLLFMVSLLCSWQIFESDLFYLLRAGSEMIQQKSFINKELWSFTALGNEWLNHQWLSQVLFALGERAVGIFYFPIFRVLLVFCTLLLSAQILRYCKCSLLETLTGCLFIFTVLFPRLQLRSELLVFTLFAAQVLQAQKNTGFRRAILVHFAFVLAWAQLHAGTAWIGGLYACAHLYDRFRSNTPVRQLLILMLPMAAVFVSPLGFHLIDVLMDHSQLLGNPELEGIHWSDLNPLNEGLTYSVVWLVAIVTLPAQLKNSQQRLVTLFLLCVLLFSLYRARILPYFAIGILPLLGALRIPRKVAAPLCLILFTSIFILNFHSPRSYGFGIDSKINPVALVDFLKKNPLQGTMLNHYNFGSYLLWALPQTPVAIDGRETPFLKFEQQMNLAAKDPQSWKAFLDKHQISYVVDTRPDDSTASIYRSHFPQNEWAAVYVDELAVVIVRRGVTNQSIINRLEIPY